VLDLLLGLQPAVELEANATKAATGATTRDPKAIERGEHFAGTGDETELCCDQDCGQQTCLAYLAGLLKELELPVNNTLHGAYGDGTWRDGLGELWTWGECADRKRPDLNWYLVNGDAQEEWFRQLGSEIELVLFTMRGKCHRSMYTPRQLLNCLSVTFFLGQFVPPLPVIATSGFTIVSSDVRRDLVQTAKWCGRWVVSLKHAMIATRY
jgi:hypothetical protein